ncbi:DUF3422 family protein [Trichloromonas acetexigens]|uniref:DUF3422 domain-containing protein n=1 Tax=Trichloromonas acetexigens TaxID=38815 RepID=A0A550JJ01_9BACT|nr:DUF3422 domain-containing protein [Desulfuromonas acetexigens]TRO83185.1 DUF3422 domain-containing protein [Desulfuromonas acetexigens]
MSSTETVPSLPFAIHPLRDALYDELHARPFHLVATPQKLTHLAFRATVAELDCSFNQLRDLCRRYSVNQPRTETPFFLQNFGQFTVRWERHTEFYALTFMAPESPGTEPFSEPVLNLLPNDWLHALPGQAVAAFHLVVEAANTPCETTALYRYFEGQKLVLSLPKGGKAQLCTAFKLHGDGFGRFHIRNLGIDDYQMGRLVQRVIELETYRLLAQLSLPIAKRIAPELNDLDHRLTSILSSLSTLESAREERELLDSLSQLAARIEAFRSETNYRFGATRAYHDLVLSRVQNIRETEVEEHMSVHEFLSRRLIPALRTCESVQTRLEDLSRRIERAGDLLRTRVNLTMQETNKSLLASMDRRGRLQFRMQETVEGLSVAAISYYMVGLAGYLFGGLPLAEWGLEKGVLMALSVPAVVTLVWWMTQRIKHRLIKDPLERKPPAPGS